MLCLSCVCVHACLCVCVCVRVRVDNGHEDHGKVISEKGSRVILPPTHFFSLLKTRANSRLSYAHTDSLKGLSQTCVRQTATGVGNNCETAAWLVFCFTNDVRGDYK